LNTTSERRASLDQFAVFTRSLKGDEKSEAQIFLDHFFRALGHGGVQEAGATLEFRIAKKPGSAQLELLTNEDAMSKRGGKKFADLLWPDRVLIEMKSRGANLEKHYDQAFDYWTHIVPKRPPYVILCNFDDLWIYDFNTQLFDPVERLAVRDLGHNPNALAFLFPHRVEPIFGNNRVAVTRKAADILAHVFRDLVFRGVARNRAQRFILQLLVALVSEDIGLLPALIVTRTLKDCVEGQSSFDLLGGLFRQMNSRQPAEGGRFQQVDYFNGGLFETIDPIELKQAELYMLHDAALHHDWSKVKPEIFGTIFQASMDKEERHAFGAHFTSEFDIQKVVGPTIVRPWRERIAAAGTLGELRTLLGELRRFRVLDPACGSGNFLYVAYREMKRLERDLLVRLRDKGEKPDRLVSAIALTQFFGLDVVPFAVELARVTLMLAKELELAEAKKTEDADGLLVFEKPLPLDNLNQQIVCADALFTPWPAADAIIGNPPYLGAKMLKPERGADYVKKLRAAYPEVPGMADFCVYWFRKAHDQLAPTARAGLVGTQNIRNNNSRAGGLDYIVKNGGAITEAISTQVWSGDAQVHVSIVNWLNGEEPGDKTLKLQRGDSVNSPWETYEVPLINSSLSVGVDVGDAAELVANQKPPFVYNGQFPRHHGFVITPDEACAMISADPRNADVVRPFLIGAEMLVHGAPQRWVIDFQKRDQFNARSYHAPFDHLQTHVLPHIMALAEKERAKTSKATGQDQQWLKTWWQHFRSRKELIDRIAALPRYIACCEVTKRPIFCFVHTGVRPDHTLEAFVLADDYSFGVISSDLHWHWFRAKCSRLTGRFRYTPETVFDTFPWPQSPTRGQIAEVAVAAVALRTLRREVMASHDWSLRELYRTLDEPGDNPLRTAQARLDTAVRAAYAVPKEADPLAFLLALNLTLAAKEKVGEKITPPGLPLPAADRAPFVTGDCIQPPSV
jgi:SAM-dependent methyltransferase